MKINEKYYITKKHGSASVIVTNLIDDKKKTFTDTDMEYSPLLQIIQTCRQANKGSRTAEEIRTTLNRLYLMVGVTSDFDARYPDYCAIAVVKDEDGNIVKEVDKEEAMRCLKRLEKFFSEYSFNLSHRFVNTLGWVADKQAYIRNYFLIQNDANAVDIADKVTSDEFKSIMEDLEASGYEHPTETINKRLLVFFGAPGSGKTTLLRTIAGLIDYEGSITVDGEEVKKMPYKERAKKISLLSQMNSAYFSYSVYETVKMGRYRFQKGFFDTYKDEDIKFIEECMKRADILDIKDERIGELSGGQLQRVYLAQLFAQDSEYIFLDEPTNHLDLKYRVKLEKELQEKKVSTLCVYHDIRAALDMADNIILIKNGEIVKQGKTCDIKKSEALNLTFDMDVLSYLS